MSVTIQPFIPWMDVPSIRRSFTTSSPKPSYRSDYDGSKLVALEGLIGIGKSTLCKRLVESFPENIEVYREESNEKMLQLFYKDPIKYGFCLQWGMLKSRIYQMRLAQHDKRFGRWPFREMYFWDRSMIGDYIFALWNHFQGGISKEEMETYECEFGGSIKDIEQLPFLKDIDLFVLLNDEPSQCKHRIENVRGNQSEQGIPLAYYDGLDDIHFHIFMLLLKKKITKVYIQSWTDYPNVSITKTLYHEIIEDKTVLPTVTVNNTIKLSQEALIYDSEESIMNTYRQLGSTSLQFSSIKDVHIPFNMMTISPQDKNVDPQLCEEYGVTFYRNEYKRVVLWHLSQKHNVHLYEWK